MLQTEQKMAKVKTMLAWNFSSLGYEANDTGEVTKSFVKFVGNFSLRRKNNQI